MLWMTVPEPTSSSRCSIPLQPSLASINQHTMFLTSESYYNQYFREQEWLAWREYGEVCWRLKHNGLREMWSGLNHGTSFVALTQGKY